MIESGDETELQREPAAFATDIKLLLELACMAALRAGSAILEVYYSGEFGVDYKADASPITRADNAAHAIVSQCLLATGLPLLSEEGAQVLYEERRRWEWYWLVDPLDGTKEFVNRNGEFTVNIALMHRCTPVAGVVYAPCLDTLYYGSKATGVYKVKGAEKTQLVPLPERRNMRSMQQLSQLTVVASRSHLNQETENFISLFKEVTLCSLGSSLKFMLLAEGKAGLYPRFAPTMEWDTAASHAILNALNLGIYAADLKIELVYNKENLLNPSFICF